MSFQLILLWPFLRSFYNYSKLNFFESNNPGRIAELGYLTGITTDICYHQCWRANCYHDKRTLFKEFIQIFQKKMSLDFIGLSLVLCEILRTYIGKIDSFEQYGKCFNGRSLLDYQLSQLAHIQNNWISNGRKFVTFLENNLKHGSRVGGPKFSDGTLKNYLQIMTQHPETMIVVVSDHGTWLEERYLALARQESAIDKNHPVLFVILPENEKKFFTGTELNNLWTNQNRLLTMRDLHFLFAKFWNEKKGRLKEHDLH